MKYLVSYDHRVYAFLKTRIKPETGIVGLSIPNGQMFDHYKFLRLAENEKAAFDFLLAVKKPGDKIIYRNVRLETEEIFLDNLGLRASAKPSVMPWESEKFHGFSID